MAYPSTAFGYHPQRFGFTQPQRRRGYSPLASALAGSALTGPSPLTGGGNAQRSFYATAPAPSEDPTGGGAPYKPPTPGPVPGRGPNLDPTITDVPTTTPYDINTDPILQQITAYLGKSDEEAQAAALAQKKQALLAYGDPNLVSSLLPGETDLASAAAGNPTSTLAGLKTQRERNTHSLTEALNQNNLFYSGARIVQEQQAAQDYMNALAQAAGAVQGGLGTIDSNLAAALGQNSWQRLQAKLAAADRHKDDTGGPPPPGGTPPPGGPPPPPPGDGPPPPPPPPTGQSSFYVTPYNITPGIHDFLAALLENKKRAGLDALNLSSG
jgi:hypothetical protein